jgi:DNA-binding transcriptional LysR family regulator
MPNNQLLGSMQVFISVVDSGSFSESARRLGLSQPSISRQVTQLETHLGVRLLQRTTRRISLTEAGQIYYEKARKIQRDVYEASQSISGFKDTPAGLLRLSAPHTWTETIIAPHLAEFLKKYPLIKLNIECNDIFQDIIEDRLDLVIRVGYLKDSSYIAIPLSNIRLVLCATADYIKQHGQPKTATDLQNHNFILFEDYNKFTFSNANDKQVISINGTLSSNMVSVMLAAARQSIGMVILPDLLINPLLESGELIDIMPEANFKIKNLPILQMFALYSNRKHLPAKVRAFIDFYRTKI